MVVSVTTENLLNTEIETLKREIDKAVLFIPLWKL